MQQELPISYHLKRSLSAYSIRAPTEGEKSRHFNKIHHCLALTLVSLAKGLERINLICSKSFTLRLPFPLQRAHPWLPRAASCSNSMLAMCTRVALRDSAGGFGINTIKKRERKGSEQKKGLGNHCGKSRSLHPICFGKQVSVSWPLGFHGALAKRRVICGSGHRWRRQIIMAK